MTTREERLVAARAANAVQQWPTFEEAFGCMDCHFLFARVTNGACPLCGSSSVMDVAQFFNKGIGFNAVETTSGLTEIVPTYELENEK